MRINIESSIYRDSRFLELIIKVGCRYKAMGMVVTAWELAQSNWIKYKSVPKKKWPLDLNVLIEVGLADLLKSEAEPKPDRIYVRGSRSRMAFLEKMSEMGKKGGRSKSPKKLKNLKQYRNYTEAETETKPKGTEVSYSYSNSNYCSNSGNGNGNHEYRKPTNTEIFEKAFTPAHELKIYETMLIEAFGGAPPPARLKRRITNIASSFKPDEFASWLTDVINAKNCPQPAVDVLGFTRYLSAAIDRELKS